MPFGKSAKNRTQVVRNELGQSFGHFRTAASHAAQGAAERIGPKVGSAMVTIGLRKPPKRRRWPWIAGAIGVGAIAGVAVLNMVKRRRDQWEDYTATEAGDDLRDIGRDAAGKSRGLADDAGDKAKDLAGKAQEKAADMAGSARDKAGQLADKASAAAGRAGDKIRSGSPNGLNTSR
ncbi:YtxH domain-containing protein [Phytomonospora sp. NPDC050363]|uniref:YtxH domain-containing protein n=1 Tax=Phytomonospora sp. NPDC050363 TaxID=3155642 RepID=UPI0033FB809E